MIDVLILSSVNMQNILLHQLDNDLYLLDFIFCKNAKYPVTLIGK
jgi:hypothetical protein